MRAFVSFWAVAFLSLGTAAAETALDFDGLAAGATTVPAERIAGLSWPFVGGCSSAQAGFDREQCEALKRRAKVAAAQTRYRVSAQAPTRVVKGKLVVYGCLECGEGRPSITIGSGKSVREGGLVLGPVVGMAPFEGKALANPVETEFLFALGSRGEPKLIGFRTFDVCTGAVLAANPPSGDRNPTKSCDDKADK